MSAPTLQIAGYASLFHQTDLSGDQVIPGAFSASILALENGRLPMLFGHETQNPIGALGSLGRGFPHAALRADYTN